MATSNPLSHGVSVRPTRPTWGLTVRYTLAAMAIVAAAWHLVVVNPAVVLAAPLSSPVEVGLRFGGLYGDSGRTHSGMDVMLPAGAPALSAVSGSVTFAGLVPATAGEYRVGAVSVRCAGGAIVTLSPISETAVRRGDYVAVGDPLGQVGPAGDVSSAKPHIHLSERVRGEYVDPSHLLASWLACYGGGALGSSVSPPASSAARTPLSTPAPLHSTAAMVPAPPVTVGAGQEVIGSSGADAQPSLSLTPVPTPEMGLVLRRELALHPESRMWGAADAMERSMRRQSIVDSRGFGYYGVSSGRAIALGGLPLNLVYLGAGLVALAVGLGFALQSNGQHEEARTSHRLGSTFAVRGERW